MPLFDFVCKTCGSSFELLVRGSSAPVCPECGSAMKGCIRELSEQRMARRAPNQPIDFGADRDYIFACLQDVEASFGLRGFPGLAPEQIPARALIGQFIVWWRTLEPADAVQQAAYARLSGTIRLIDTISNWWGAERG